MGVFDGKPGDAGGSSRVGANRSNVGGGVVCVWVGRRVGVGVGVVVLVVVFGGWLGG